MRVPRWPSRRAIVIAIVVIVIGYLSVPVYLDYSSPAADPKQYKCQPDERLQQLRRTTRPRQGPVVMTVRLTDDGQFVNRCESTDAFYELNWNHPQSDVASENVAVDPTADPNLPKFVVIYVHGWKNDERQDSGDYKDFKELIGKLADDPNYKGKKHVTGIYVSWDATFYPIIENLTFWSRMRAADRIAQSATLTKFITGVESILSRDNNKQNQLVVIGHSFGARMVFSATIQNLLHSVQREHPGKPKGTYGTIRGSADAVILLNPAFEASLFSGAASIFREDEQFQPNQPPVLISISTINDSATGTWFPIGQWVGWRTALERRTLGYFRSYQTHTLRKSEALQCFSPGEEVNGKLSYKSYLAGLCMEPLAHRVAQPTNPFLVAQTDSTIINGHSGIWNPKFSEWLFQLVKELGEQHKDTTKSLGETKTGK